MKEGLSSALSEMPAEEETMPMTDEERAYLEEHYRYQCCFQLKLSLSQYYIRDVIYIVSQNNYLILTYMYLEAKTWMIMTTTRIQLNSLKKLF